MRIKKKRKSSKVVKKSVVSSQNTFYFSATMGKKEDTLLYSECPAKTQFFFKENNTDSLPVVYNKAIDFAIQEKCDYLVLCHDDVLIESDIASKIPELLAEYDVIGVAGASEVTFQEPALWHLMGGGFGGGKLHGAVAHGSKTHKSMTSFGSYPHRAILIDGVFMAIHRRAFTRVRFDESNPAGFHHYDLLWSCDCVKAGLKVGVSDIMITHASPGLREYTPDFLAGQEYFLNKYPEWKGKKIQL